MRKKQILWLTPFILAIVCAGLLLLPRLNANEGRTTSGATGRSPKRVPVPVITAVAKTEAFTETLEALGTARANESVIITPTLEERVVGIFFDDGDDVNKGQVLVKLDDSEARFLLAEARAGLQEQQKQFERTRKLAKTNATSRSRLDEELSLLEIAKAKVANLEARLRDYTIRAPFAGILGIRQISTGAVVDSDTIIATLDDTRVIKLDFTIPETYLGALYIGMDITAHSPAYPGRNFDGKVSAISSRVDPATRTLTVRARIPNPERRLKPGMLLTVDLVKDRSQSLIIPEEAVILEKDKKYTLVVNSANTVEKREIVTGRRSPGKVEVVSGLSAGHQVIIDGLARVKPGAAVNVVEVRNADRPTG